LVIFIFALTIVAATPLLIKDKVVVLSHAQQEGGTCIIVVKAMLLMSVEAVEFAVPMAPGIKSAPFLS
jgi:hypothetical protein